MNLRGVVHGVLGTVNPDQPVTWLQFQSYSTVNTITTPVYAPAQTLTGQVQPLSTDQLAHMEQLNIQGVLRQVYLKGAVATAVRKDGTGGDLLQFPEIPGGPSRSWLVVLSNEQWPDWCRVTTRLQND